MNKLIYIINITNLVKYDKYDLLADIHNILLRQKNYLSAEYVSDNRQIKIRAAEPLVPDLVILLLKLMFQSLKGINCQVVNTFQQN
jgi:hypothetical protein